MSTSSRTSPSPQSSGVHSVGQQPTTVQVTVPPGVAPGQQFQINVGGQLKAITVPAGVAPGSTLTINL